jgi:hypothetical protein
MNILQLLISWQFLILALVISAATTTIKDTCESIWILADVKWWKVTNPIMPLAIGAVFGLAFSNFPYPELIQNNTVGQVCFCLVAGEFSSFVYRFVKAAFEKEIG